MICSEFCTNECTNGSCPIAIDIGLNVGYKLHKSIPIQQIKDGIVIKEYPSINSVRYDGFDVSNVNKCLKGRLKTYKGYEWRHLW